MKTIKLLTHMQDSRIPHDKAALIQLTAEGTPVMLSGFQPFILVGYARGCAIERAWSGLQDKGIQPSVVTPFNLPDKLPRIKDALSPPTACPHCGGVVAIIDKNETPQGYVGSGEWSWVFRCQNVACRAEAGIHPKTLTPVGPLLVTGLQTQS